MTTPETHSVEPTFHQTTCHLPTLGSTQTTSHSLSTKPYRSCISQEAARKQPGCGAACDLTTTAFHLFADGITTKEPERYGRTSQTLRGPRGAVLGDLAPYSLGLPPVQPPRPQRPGWFHHSYQRLEQTLLHRRNRTGLVPSTSSRSTSSVIVPSRHIRDSTSRNPCRRATSPSTSYRPNP